MKKFEFHFHNDQGAFLATIVSASLAGAKKKFHATWSGPAKVTKGRQV